MTKVVCVDVRMAFCSGIGTYIRNLVSRVKNSPFQWVFLAHPEVVKQWKELENADIILTKVPYYSVREQWELPRIIPACDVFWSPHYNIPVLSIRSKKRLVTIHDVYHLLCPSRFKRLYAKTLLSQAVRKSDCILTVSEFSKQEILKYLGPTSTPIHVIYPGVDRLHFYPRETVTDIKIKYNLPDKFLLFVGNLTPHKNVQGIQKALSYLADPFFPVILVGKTKDREKSEDERIRYLGAVDDADLPFLYQLATVLVHPSLYEGFGLTPLEAMSSGCPVVASCRASLPEVCGDAAILVDPLHPSDIARGIEEAITQRTSLQEKGFKRCLSFDWNRAAEQLLKVLEFKE